MVTVTLLEEESEEPVGEESPVEILLQRFSEDGGVEDELRLEGDLGDAQRLVLKLSSEGNCVEVEVAAAGEEEAGAGEEEEAGAGEEEEAGAGEEVAEPAELPEPASP